MRRSLSLRGALFATCPPRSLAGEQSQVHRELEIASAKQQPRNDVFKRKRVLVMGLGKSGLAACRLLRSLGAQVQVTDERPRRELKKVLRSLPSSTRVEAGSHRFLSREYDLIVVSPGVPWNQPQLVKARKKGIPMWPELELGWRCVRPFKTVAVTGTNGKTTTTAMIGHILKKAGQKVVVGGNIGTPLSALVKKVTPRTILVLEVSSYQLEAHQTFHPDVAVLLNVTPDHLARHKNMNQYASAKGRILMNMTRQDNVVYNQKDFWCRMMVKSSNPKKIPFPSLKLFHLAQRTLLRGQHNLENTMAAVGAVQALGFKSNSILKGVKSFSGVRHRIQIVGKRRGVLYVNDSKATNVDSTLVALRSFSEPLVLLLGGEHKGSPYTPLLPELKKRAREVVAYGESQAIIVKDLKNQVPISLAETLPQAVKRAAQVAQRGDVVLLSPACASFDQFKNFEHRGEEFISLVKRLPK